MKYMFVVLLGIVAAGCKASETPKQAAVASALPHDEATIVELNRKLFAAFDGVDPDAVEALLAPEFLRVGRARFNPANNVLGNLRVRKDRGFPVVSGRTFRLTRVRFFGDAAVLTGMTEAQLVRAEGVAPTKIERSVTQVWTSATGAWKLANWQDEPAGPEADRMNWNETYRESGALNLEPNKLLVEAVHDRKPGKALDVGMGQGRNTLFLASGGWDVTGVDIADEGIRQAHETAKATGLTITTEVADLDTWDWGEAKYDLVALIYMGAKPPVDKVRRALQPGGIVVIEHFRADANAGTGISAFKTGELPELFKDGFKVLRHDEVEDIADWGLRRVPLSRFVAEKL